MNESRSTTIENELGLMQEMLESKVKHFKPVVPASLEEQIFRVFKSSSRVAISPEESAKIQLVIAQAISVGEPVRVSFLWAVCWMCPSPYKFLQPELVEPRLADYWAPFWFEILNRKVKKIYSPGCEFYIIDEFPMIQCLGWDRKRAEKRLPLLQNAYAKFPCTKIIEMPDFKELPEVGELSVPEVLATVISAESLIKQMPPEVMRELIKAFYRSGAKDWDSMKSKVPKHIWDEACVIKRRMNQLGSARRTTGWLDNEILHGKPFIDGAMVDKKRWSPDICSLAMSQHGGSVLDCQKQNYRYSISIIPEYRLMWTHTPVTIKTAANKDLIFYWTKNTE